MHCVRESASSINFSVVVRFLRDAVGMFCAHQWACRRAHLAAGTYVIDCGEGAVGSPHSSARVPEAFECLLYAVSHCTVGRSLRHVLTGDVTSCTRCRSVPCQWESARRHGGGNTDIEQNVALLFIDNMVLEDLVVQSLWRSHGRRHPGGCVVRISTMKAWNARGRYGEEV